MGTEAYFGTQQGNQAINYLSVSIASLCCENDA
jgi:hypothetical protein